MKKPTLREAHNTDKVSGHRPDIQLLHHAQQTVNTTFLDCHPNVPPLALKIRHPMSQPPASQAAQGNQFADHDRCTNILKEIHY
jgi:hypothetical protein